MILFVDTETTGLVDHQAAPDAPHQPRLVQLGLVLSEPERYFVRARASLIIHPDGWTVPDNVAAIHGLSTEVCQRCGIPLDVAWSVLYTFASQASLIVAHNAEFDRTVLDGEWLRRRHTLPPVEGIWYCTKEAAAPVLRLPGKSTHPSQAQRSQYKWPTLDEAHRFFFGASLPDHHDALADAEACAGVYYALQEDLADERREAVQP